MEKEKNIPSKTLTKDDVLVAALKLFAEKGYFNTSLVDIKEQLGIKTTSGIYQHFQNKQLIAATLYENILDSLSISIDDIRRRNKKSSEQLREIVDLLFKLTDDAPEVMRFLLLINIQEFLPEGKPLSQTVAYNKIKRIFQNGIKNGEIKSIEPAMAYTAFFGVVNHALEMVLLGSLEKQADSYQSQVWMIAWNCVAKKI